MFLTRLPQRLTEMRLVCVQSSVLKLLIYLFSGAALLIMVRAYTPATLNPENLSPKP